MDPLHKANIEHHLNILIDDFIEETVGYIEICEFIEEMKNDIENFYEYCIIGLPDNYSFDKLRVFNRNLTNNIVGYEIISHWTKVEDMGNSYVTLLQLQESEEFNFRYIATILYYDDINKIQISVGVDREYKLDD